jgi:hypothetical protein
MKDKNRLRPAMNPTWARVRSSFSMKAGNRGVVKAL